VKEQFYTPSLDIVEVYRFYTLLLIFVLLPLLFVWEEGIRPGGMINNYIRKEIFKQGSLWDYLGEDPYKVPYDDEIPICDYRNMTAKRFYNDFVA
jgi:hypothetical protein